MYRKYGKRILDLLFALILVVLLSPVLLLITIVIKIDSKGPAIFKQVRSGKYNKEFMLYKFRSMSVNNDFYDTKREDQLTRVGAFLRKTSLDELPQLFNIIKGDMSFIGPRPWVIDYSKYFTKKQMRRLNVLPGITGLAQCSGRNNLTILKRIKIDIYYVDNISLKMDIMIVLKTVMCILKRDGFSNSKSAIHRELKVLRKQYIKKCGSHSEFLGDDELNNSNLLKKKFVNKNLSNNDLLVGSEVL